ncbi:hypothetical protein SAMN05444274_10592 [Mariniphaga anaerophila]|uniref:Outer membrane protein beta-barrel domain-containing protein n=1 Tax=Mariniphaga anaerophila TaxID=1484053 RepID=A0A1M5BCM5_9BACT|nr:hypothetical protein [Mariniphaga anaerophila]SHF40331.1 hypothetical protein SAMN05444274_10592 [Mariniphaga anaerophila]
MKTTLLILLCTVLWGATKAQDRIITIRQDTIECRILSVGEERITYEQNTSENYVEGKSIAISEVLRYLRTNPGGDNSGIRQQKAILQKREYRFMITLQEGFAHSFIDLTGMQSTLEGAGIPKRDARDYTRSLKNGFYVNVGGHYLLNSYIGVGAEYSMYFADSEGSFLVGGDSGDGLNVPYFAKLNQEEEFSTHFTGVSVLSQHFLGEEKNIKFWGTVSPGIVWLRNEIRAFELQTISFEGYEGEYELVNYYDNSNGLVKGTTFGVKGGLSLEYCFSSILSAGVAVNYTWAELNKIGYDSSYGHTEQKLADAIVVSHLDYGFTVRYQF